MQARQISSLVLVGSLVLGCSGGGTRADSPEAAVKSVQQAILDNQPAQIFEALPASYQSDINSLVADAAGRMDADLWNAVHGLLSQAVGIMESKRDLILETDSLAMMPNKAEVEANWDQMVKTLQVMLSSDLTNLEVLRQRDVKGLLAGSGAKMMAEFKTLVEDSEGAAEMAENLAKLESMKVTTLSNEDGKATVRVEVDGEEPEEVEMMQVEGAWLPVEMAEGFKEGIAEAREGLKEIDFTTPEGQQMKSMVMMQTGAVKAMLDQLEQAQTKEDIENVMGGMMMGIMSMMGGMGSM